LLIGPAEAEGVARLAELWPDLRVGFDWACAAGDHELADALVRPVVGEVNLRRQTEISGSAAWILALTPPAQKEDVDFWLVCVTYRSKQGGDHDRYEGSFTATGLMNDGRFPELDDHASALAAGIAPKVRRPCCTWH